jgi:hypothetical protein
MGFAASLFGMMVSAGAATGVAIVTDALTLTAGHQLHRESLSAHLSLLKASNGVAVSTGMARSQAGLLPILMRALTVLVLCVSRACCSSEAATVKHKRQ